MGSFFNTTSVPTATQLPFLGDEAESLSIADAFIPDTRLRQEMIDATARRLFRRNPEYARFSPFDANLITNRVWNFLFAVETEPHDPAEVFERLRWGGVFIYISRHRGDLASLPQRFRAEGFEILHPSGCLKSGRFCFIPFVGKRLYFFACRKLQLIRPADLTERFTFNVQLSRAAEAGVASDEKYVVVKQVPPIERVMARLSAKFPEADAALISRRAVKFTRKIFPLMLTREAAMLKILQKYLPEAYRSRIPRVIHLDTDERGMATRLVTNWMRIGGQPMPHLEFARQSMDFLRVLHDEARVTHLDLRLDNMLITEQGVCFIDFGASLREGEEIDTNPLLANLFGELTRTSVIQTLLRKMIAEGTATSPLLRSAVGRADKQIDLFYLSLQNNKPLHNPDFRGLVDFDPQSFEAKALAEIFSELLRPKDPSNPRYVTAADVLRAIERVGAARRVQTAAQEAAI